MSFLWEKHSRGDNLLCYYANESDRARAAEGAATVGGFEDFYKE